jgi:hypothetical protein
MVMSKDDVNRRSITEDLRGEQQQASPQARASHLAVLERAAPEVAHYRGEQEYQPSPQAISRGAAHESAEVEQEYQPSPQARSRGAAHESAEVEQEYQPSPQARSSYPRHAQRETSKQSECSVGGERRRRRR